MKTKLTSALIMALTLALLVAIVPAMASFNNVSFNGQGFAINESGDDSLQIEICGPSTGADVTAPYLFWILSAPSASNAEISGPWGSAIMTRSGSGTFTYRSSWYDPQDLSASRVSAIYDGRPGTATLVVSHGCAPSR
jgi:hypothetical protein